MQPLTFNCEIITPMFAGSALPGDCELRPPAIKGALRFWWRAMNGHLSISDLRKREAEIFGSSDENNGRSKVIITTSHLMITSNLKFSPNPTYRRKIQKEKYSSMTKNLPLLEYLAFGAITGQTYKNYYPAGGKFDILLNFNDSLISEGDLKTCFSLIASFGGIGSKARNGFGRFKILNEGFPEVLECIKPLKKAAPSEFTSFSSDISLYKLNGTGNTNWNTVLAQLAKAYIGARVNYHNGSAKTSFGIEDEHVFDKRPFIGSPVLEGKQTHLPKVLSVKADKLQRHAKTHFFGIIDRGKSFDGYILHLPYKYLSGSELILSLSTTDISQLQSAYNSTITSTGGFNDKLITNGLLKVALL